MNAADLNAALASRRVLVIHFWATWNGVDRLFEPEFRTVREAFAGLAEFRSVDVDFPELVDFCRDCGVTNVPSVAGFAEGRHVETLVGRRSAQ